MKKKKFMQKNRREISNYLNIPIDVEASVLALLPPAALVL